MAELARIVAGEPAPVRKSPAPQAVDPRSFEIGTDLDIEAELMRELGEAEPGRAAVEETPVASVEQQIEPVAQPVRSLATPVASPSARAQELSLEEQLMAELSGEAADDYSAGAADTEMADYSAENLDGAANPEYQPEADPFDKVEEIAASFRSGLNPHFDDAGHDHHHSGHITEPPPLNADQQVDAGDELDDFFADGFSDLLGKDNDEPAQPLKKSLATPLIPARAEFQAPAAPQFDDIEMDFSDAFEEELAQVSVQAAPTAARVAASVDPGIEDDFARIFEEQMQWEKPGDEPVHELVADNRQQADFAAAPQVGRAAVMHDPAPDFDDFKNETVTNAAFAAAPSRNGFKLAVGALSLALVVGLGVVAWGAYSGVSGTSTGEPAIIKADNEPIKVKPEEPGGKVIENQDNQVYSKVAGTQAEEKVQDELISSREQVSEDAKATNRLAPRDEPEPQQATLGISPKKVRTLTVKPDGTIIQAEPEAPAAAEQVAALVPAAPAEPLTRELALDAPASEPVVEPSNEATSEETTALASIDGASSTGAVGIPTPSPLPAAEPVAAEVVEVATPKPVEKAAPTPVASEPAATAATDPNAPTQIANLNSAPASTAAATPTVSSSEWKVQVSSQRSRDAAEASFNNIQNRFGSLLSGRSANIERADVDGKGTFYRVKILADSKSSATELCTRLKSAGGSCFVTR